VLILGHLSEPEEVEKAASDAYIPLPVPCDVGAAITKQCDAADGVADVSP